MCSSVCGTNISVFLKHHQKNQFLFSLVTVLFITLNYASNSNQNNTYIVILNLSSEIWKTAAWICLQSDVLLYRHHWEEMQLAGRRKWRITGKIVDVLVKMFIQQKYHFWGNHFLESCYFTQPLTVSFRVYTSVFEMNVFYIFLHFHWKCSLIMLTVLWKGNCLKCSFDI